MMENDLKYLVDAPCGSFHWQGRLLHRLRAKGLSVRYSGFDIVESVIVGLQSKYSNDTALSFSVADITSDKLPHGADLILSRDRRAMGASSREFTNLQNVP